jgi:hypothetical protein
MIYRLNNRRGAQNRCALRGGIPLFDLRFVFFTTRDYTEQGFWVFVAGLRDKKSKGCS